MKKSRLPKGLMILTLLIIAGSVYAVVISILKPYNHMICVGQIFQGLPFKAYYLVLGLINLFIGVGLFLRRRWSYFFFLAFSTYSVLLAGTNILFTSEDTLVRAGWVLPTYSLENFYLLQAASILVTVLMVLWLLHYRREFRKILLTNMCSQSPPRGSG